jgi:hypothetical protein
MTFVLSFFLAPLYSSQVEEVVEEVVEGGAGSYSGGAPQPGMGWAPQPHLGKIQVEKFKLPVEYTGLVDYF